MSVAVSKRADQAWSVRNEQIVMLAIMGMFHQDIAKRFGITRSQVTNIVNDPRAEAIKEATRERMRESLLSSLEDELDTAAKLSVKALKKTLDADISPMHKAKANQDRVATKILAGRGFLRVEDRTASPGIQMSPEQFDRLMSAMEKGDRVQKIDPFAVMDAEVVEEEEEESDSSPSAPGDASNTH